LLQGVLPFEVAFVQSGASTAGPEPISWGLPPLAGRLLTRRADTVWSELAGIRAARWGWAAWSRPPGLVSADSELGRIMRSERPVRHLCLAALEEGRTALVLGRAGEPFTRRELELVRLALRSSASGDRRASEVQEALGARLTPREQEIFDYVSRGYNNREIASALGTSHFTVRKPALPPLPEGGRERPLRAGGAGGHGHPARAHRLAVPDPENERAPRRETPRRGWLGHGARRRSPRPKATRRAVPHLTSGSGRAG
jgi:hypothetical protein